MSDLISLPPELIQLIARKVGHSGSKTLRLVCRLTSEALAASILRRIVLCVHRSNGLHMLRTLATNKRHPAREFTQHLVIYPILGLSLTSASDIITIMHLKLFLRPALKSLKRLAKLTWWRTFEQPPWTTDAITKAINRYHPQLTAIKVVLGQDRIPFLDNLTQLTHLCVMPDLDMFPCRDTARNLANDRIMNAVSRAAQKSSATLQSFTIAGPLLASTNTLQDFLGEANVKGDEPLRGFVALTSLSFTSYSGQLWSATASLPQLSSLQSFRLDHRPAWNITPYVDRRYPEVTGSDRCSIWTALRNTGIRLKVVSCSHFSPELFEYLTSYRNVLEELDISDCHQDPFLLSEALADTLINWTLPNHRQSLRTIAINSEFEGGWCFGEGMIGFFSKRWPKLRELSVGVGLRTPWAHKHEDFPVGTLLKKVTRPFNFPAMETLNVTTVLSGAELRDGSSPYSMEDSRRVDARSVVASAIEGYHLTSDKPGRGADSPKYPPYICLDKMHCYPPKVFYPVEISGGWGYRLSLE